MIINILEMLDFFGVPLCLNVFGKKKYRSLLGSFVSVCSIIFFSFAFQQKFRDFVNYKSIDVKQSIVQEDSPSEIIINSRDLMFAMRFEIWQNNALQSNNSSIPFSFQISAVSQTLKSIDSKLQKIVKVQNIPAVQCTKNHFTNQKHSVSEYVDTYFRDIKVESYFCPQIDIPFNLKGNQNSFQYDFFKFNPLQTYEKDQQFYFFINNFLQNRIEIVSCQGKPNCWSQKEIDDYIATNEFFKAQIIFNTYIPNYGDSDYLKPFIYSKKFYKLIPSMMKPIAEFFFAENQINSDESWFWFSTIKEEKVIMYSEEEYRENVIGSSLSSTSYGEFLFQRSSYTLSTSRDYEKIDSILSYMVDSCFLLFFNFFNLQGGFIQIVLVSTQLGMEFYNSQNLKLKFANQLYSFEKNKELSEEDKDISKFSSRQDFLQNVFDKFQRIPQKLTLSLSYFIYRLTCEKLFDSERNQILFEAMKQNNQTHFNFNLKVDKDLNMYEILVRLHEFDKMKQILFTEDQKKVLEYSEKPQINMETIQQNIQIQDIQRNEQIMKQKREQEKSNQKASIFQRSRKIVFEILKSKNQKDQHPSLKNKILSENQALYQRSDKKEKSALITKKINSAFWKRVQTISSLLIEENAQKNNMVELNEPPNLQNNDKKGLSQFQISPQDKNHIFQQQQQLMLQKSIGLTLVNSQMSNSLDPLKQLESQQYEQIKKNDEASKQNLLENRCSDLFIREKNKSISNNNDDGSDNDEDLSLLQKFLQQKQNFQGKLIQLIRQMRPSTFYSLRTDYSQFSSFYELFDICEVRIFMKKNKPNNKQPKFYHLFNFNLFYARLTKKVIGLLRKDLLNAFSLAKSLKSIQQIEKEKKVEQMIHTFITNMKRKILSQSILQRKGEQRENTNEISFPTMQFFQQKNMNSLKDKHHKKNKTQAIFQKYFEQQIDDQNSKNVSESNKYIPYLRPKKNSINKDLKIHLRRCSAPDADPLSQDQSDIKFEKEIKMLKQNEATEKQMYFYSKQENRNQILLQDYQFADSLQQKNENDQKDFIVFNSQENNQDTNIINFSESSFHNVSLAEQSSIWNFKNNIQLQIALEISKNPINNN